MNPTTFLSTYYMHGSIYNVCFVFLPCSWHLFQCLMGLDYTHLSPNMLAHLHTSYASQLENAGLWQWAVFVALHMNEDQRYCVYIFVICVQSDPMKFWPKEDSFIISSSSDRPSTSLINRFWYQ